MTAAKSALCFIIAITAAGNIFGSEWNYQDQKHWPQTCYNGKAQSPIALTRYTATEKEFPKFILNGYDNKFLADLKNNGHSAEVRLNVSSADSKPEVRGGGLPSVYQLDHLHFHWQSEHTMGGHRFPLELHLVHYAKEYGNLKTAVQKPSGVAVFAVLFVLSPDDDDDVEPPVKIFETLQSKVGETKRLDEFTVKNFLPRDLAGFYRYEGSLTTPGCNEGILWTVFTNSIPISRDQVNVFPGMQASNRRVLKKNYRELQDLNGRTVYLKISPIEDGAKTIQSSLTLMLCSYIVYYVIGR